MTDNPTCETCVKLVSNGFQCGLPRALEKECLENGLSRWQPKLRPACDGRGESSDCSELCWVLERDPREYDR